MGRTDISSEPPALEQAPRSTGDWRRMLPGLLVSLAALAAVFYFADLRQMGAALRQANLALILAAVVLTLGWLLIRSFAWRTLLRERARLGDVFWSLNEGYLLNNVLPFRLGEVGRALLLGQKSGLDFWQVLPTILVERILDVSLAVGLLLSTVPFVIGAARAREAAGVTGAVMLVGLVSLYLIGRNPRRVMDLFEWANTRFGRRLPLLGRLGSRALPSFLEGLAVFQDGRRFLLALGWMLINWTLGAAQYVVTVRAFFPDAPLLWGAFTLGIAAMGVAAPSSPGSLGVFEGSVVFALSLFGQDASTALALAFTLHFIQIGVTGLLGVIGLARDGESLSGLYRKLRSSRLNAES